MSFAEAITSALTKVVRFSGRARRSEYWWFALFSNLMVLLVFVCALPVALVTGSPTLGWATDGAAVAVDSGLTIGQALAYLPLLALFLPLLAVSIRRLHDTNRSGWLCLIAFVPIVGGIILLVFTCEDSSRGPNRYGPSLKNV